MLDPDDDDSVKERDDRLVDEMEQAFCYGCQRFCLPGEDMDGACIATLVVAHRRCKRLNGKEE